MKFGGLFDLFLFLRGLYYVSLGNTYDVFHNSITSGKFTASKNLNFDLI